MSEDDLVAFLQEKGLLHRERSCAKGHAMKLTSGRSGRSPTWRCRADGCSQEVSIREGTWFDGPRRRTSLETAVLFMYDWCRQTYSIQNCERELGMCRSAAVTWNRWMRNLATEAASMEIGQTIVTGGEQVWRRRCGGQDPFEQLLKDVSTLCPPS
uniref:Uncharacterized protein n=2 Tax=Trichuris muris TaxID=70415 RepID=A0A5S6Q3J7_TRIMR